jgi:hypothetical protein
VRRHGFRKSVAKPKLKIVSAPTVEIGYSTFGPIVNLTAAISVECRDALIEKITLKATHEKGEERHLTWKWLNEKQHQIQSATGEMAEVSKNQPAVALKVSTLSLAEKIIGFQDLEFQAKAQALIATLVEHYNYLRGQSGNLIESLVKSKEFNQARDFFRSNMYWKEGRYTFEVSLQECGFGLITSSALP